MSDILINVAEDEGFLLTKPFVLGGKVDELPIGRHTFTNLYRDCSILYETYNGTLVAASQIDLTGKVVKSVYSKYSMHIKEIYDTSA